MTNKIHSVAEASHGSLGALLFTGGSIAIVLLLVIVYFLLRDKGKTKPMKPAGKVASSSRKKRRK